MMETKTSSKVLMETLINMYDWHTKLYKNAIAGISDEDSQNRLGTKANHISWIAGSVVQERFMLASFLGVDAKQTSNDLFKDHKGI
jgi:hypothetical protein